MQKHVNLVDLVKSFPTNIYLQNLASIQKRMSPIKFARLAEKSENGSISNLSTKVRVAGIALAEQLAKAGQVALVWPLIPDLADLVTDPWWEVQAQLLILASARRVER